MLRNTAATNSRVYGPSNAALTYLSVFYSYRASIPIEGQITQFGTTKGL
jgi:hypothetical protein